MCRAVGCARSECSGLDFRRHPQHVRINFNLDNLVDEKPRHRQAEASESTGACIHAASALCPGARHPTQANHIVKHE